MFRSSICTSAGVWAASKREEFAEAADWALPRLLVSTGILARLGSALQSPTFT